MKQTFSASDLVKKSASQICYLRDKPRPAATARALKGDELAEKKSIGLVEMRGMFVNSDMTIFYSFDEIVKDNVITFVEHKYVEDHDTVEDWFFNSSVLQLAFYASLHIINKNKSYVTATFRINDGYEKQCLSVEDNTLCRYVLNFGDKLFEVTISDPIHIVLQFLFKANCTIGETRTLSFKKAKTYDNLYKFKEYERLYKCFHITPIN